MIQLNNNDDFYSINDKTIVSVGNLSNLKNDELGVLVADFYRNYF